MAVNSDAHGIKEKLIQAIETWRLFEGDSLSKEKDQMMDSFITSIKDDVNFSLTDSELLLKALQHTNISQIISDHKTALMHMAEKGHVQAIKLLWVLGAKLEVKDQDGDTALMLAINAKQWQVMKTLLELYENPRTSNNDLCTPLMYAASVEGGLESIDILLEKGALLEEKNINGDTALMCAINAKQWDIAKLLIERNANVNAKNIEGYTPLMQLAITADNATIQQFIDAGLVSALEINRLKIAAIKQSEHVKLISAVGHILGVTCNIAGVDSTGMFMEIGCQLLKECLDDLPQSPFKHDLISNALNLAIECSKDNLIIDHEKLINKINERKVTIVPVSWHMHTIGLGVWNDIVIICNRGSGSLKHKISVFKMPDKDLEQALQDIIPKNQIPSREQGAHAIRNFVDTQNPLLTFQSQDQKHGTCSFANLKSLLQPILCFIKLLESQNVNPQEFNSEFLKSFLPTESNEIPTKAQMEFEAIKQESRKEYKDFTKTIRDNFVKKLCEKYKTLFDNPEEKEMYRDIFAAILSEHYGQTKIRGNPRSKEKIKEERDRALEILSVLTHDEKETLFKKAFSNIIHKDSEAYEWLTQQCIAKEKFPDPITFSSQATKLSIPLPLSDQEAVPEPTSPKTEHPKQ